MQKLRDPIWQFISIFVSFAGIIISLFHDPVIGLAIAIVGILGGFIFLSWEERRAKQQANISSNSSTSTTPPSASSGKRTWRITRRKFVTGSVIVLGMGVLGRIIYLKVQPQIIKFTGHTAEVLAVSWSPNGKYIASGSRRPDHTVQIWDPKNGNSIYTYYGHLNTINTVAWSPNGKYIASGSGDKAEHKVVLDHTVHVWDVKTYDTILIYPHHSNSVHSVAWSPLDDSKYIASGSSDDTLQVWEALTGKLLLEPVDTTSLQHRIILSVAWSPNGKYIASGDRSGIVHVWDAKKGTIVNIYTQHDFDVYSVAWSPDSRYIASGSADNTVQVWEATTGIVLNGSIYKGHTDIVYAVAWSHDGKNIASGGADNTVQVWEVNTKAPIYTYRGHAGRVNSIAWSLDGTRIASASADKTVQIWQPM